MRQGMEYRATVAAGGYDRGGEMRQGMEYRATVAAGGGDRCGGSSARFLLFYYYLA